MRQIGCPFYGRPESAGGRYALLRRKRELLCRFRSSSSVAGSSGSKRRGSFIENVEVGAVAENSAATAARNFFGDPEAHEIAQCGIHRRRGQTGARNQAIGGDKGILLEQFVKAQRGPGAVTLCRDPLPVSREKIGDTHGCIESLVRRLCDAIEEEFEPRFPGAVLANFLEQPIIVGAMLFR